MTICVIRSAPISYPQAPEILGETSGHDKKDNAYHNGGYPDLVFFGPL
jgi:hypothetical protein